MATAPKTELQATMMRILAKPTPKDLWRLQADLLALGGEAARQAREVAGEFYSCLCDLESKIASRSASRWGAILETASVTSVGLQEMLNEQDDPLRRVVSSGVTAMLEVGAAVKNVQAWEVEAALMYGDVAWYLYGELWDISVEMRPDLALAERQGFIARLLQPIVESGASDVTKSALLIRLFQELLAARVRPLLTAAERAGE